MAVKAYVVVAAGVTCAELFAATPPMPWLILIDFALMISHVRVEISAELMEAGLALKVVMIGVFDEVTVIVANAVELPALLEAVSTYLVVEPGDTFFVPLDDTVPISGSMEADVEPVTPQDTVAVCPVKILPGSILKLFMVGRMPVTLTVMDLRADPYILLATSIYVVVVSGYTFLVPLAETVPIPGLMETDVTPVAAHCKVAS